MWRKALGRFTQSKEKLRDEAYDLQEEGTGAKVSFPKKVYCFSHNSHNFFYIEPL
jgi:hypothetical protein